MKKIRSSGLYLLLACVDFALLLLGMPRLFDGARIGFVLSLINHKLRLVAGLLVLLIALLEEGTAVGTFCLILIIGGIVQLMLPRMTKTRFSRRVLAGSCMVLFLLGVLLLETILPLHGTTLLRMGVTLLLTILLV